LSKHSECFIYPKENRRRKRKRKQICQIKNNKKPGTVVYTSNSSYLGSRD
jgi:hypothetical protein